MVVEEKLITCAEGMEREVIGVREEKRDIVPPLPSKPPLMHN